MLFEKKLRNKVASILVASLTFGFISGINFNDIKVFAAVLPGAHHATVVNDVFLGGNYIEVGVNKHGSLGTESDAPTEFHPVSRANLGMSVDGDGFDVGNTPTTGDFFLPGYPYESYVVAYKDENGTPTEVKVAERAGMLGITDISTTDTSSGNTLSATTVGTTDDGKLKITQVISFDVNDKYFTIHVTYQNISGNTLYDTRYLRSVDPDQDADLNGDYSTKNSVTKNPTEDDKAIVIAKGNVTNEPFIYIASDSRARASITTTTDPYSTDCYTTDGSTLIRDEAVEDTWIAMSFDLGDISAGGSVSLNLINSLNPDLSAALNSGVTITTPADIEISRDDNTLTAKLIKDDGTDFTTSAAVTYEWYRDGNLVDGENNVTYSITNEDNGKNITVKAEAYNLTSEPFYIQDDTPVTTAAAARIEGILKVGNTLSAMLVDRDGNKFTTSAAVTYEWYRLNNSNSDFVNKIGGNKTYGLTSSDLNKYIGLRVAYDGNSFDAVSGKILASSSSSSSSSHHHSSTTSTDTVSTSAADTNTTKNDNKTGWSQDANGEWKFVESNGNKATGWKLVDNKWYFFNNKSGAMVTGWYKSEAGDWKYNGQDTVNQWFHLDADGKLTIGWYKDNDGTWYYLCNGSQDGALGVMKTGWQFIDGKWYYLNSNGSMVSNAVVEGYILGSDGAWIQQ